MSDFRFELKKNDNWICQPWLIWTLLAIMILSANQRVCANQATGEPRETKAVRLVIDYGDGVEKHFTRLTVTGQVTCLELMQQAKKHKRGISFKHQGKGATALLLEIDGVKNEGNGKNWVFRINDQLGDRSFGIATVKAGDTLKWSFETLSEFGK